MGGGLLHMTLIKLGPPLNISPKWVKLQTSNLAYGCMWIISRKWTNKISEKGSGLGHVTLISALEVLHSMRYINLRFTYLLIICSILWHISKQESLANTKVMHDSSACNEGPYGTNLSSTGNPTIKTVKGIPRYVIKPRTYFFYYTRNLWNGQKHFGAKYGRT